MRLKSSVERCLTKSDSSDSLVITGRLGFFLSQLLHEFVDLFLLQGEFFGLELGLHQIRIVGRALRSGTMCAC